MFVAKEINVGLIGHLFMGKAHSLGYKDVAMFFPDIELKPRMRMLAGLGEESVRQAAEQYGWESYGTDYKALITRDDIDLVDIATGNDTHKEMALAAAAAGKHIFCEKPMAMNVAECKEMIAAVEKAGVKHAIDFNYRCVPAVALAKKMIDDGLIGKIYHWRGVYLQDWIMDPKFPLVWRLVKKNAGSGPHGDLNAHLIDLARFLVGEITDVVGMMETFIKKRPLLGEAVGGLSATATDQMGDVTVDDATLFLARFDNGAIGSFEATRFAGGRRNGNRFEINGSEGSIAFNLERMNEIEYYSKNDPAYAQGFKTIIVGESVHPYMSAWWPPGHIIGWQHTFVHQIYNLCNSIGRDQMPVPNFYDGLKCQQTLEAVETSVENHEWVKVEK
jgi:predicted dehydrogenase